MTRKVWIVSHYAMPPHLEMRVKTLRFAQYLQDVGYDVLLITASTIHNTDINLIQDKSLYIEKEYDGLKFVHIKCNQYNGSRIKRIINLYQFQYNFCKVMKNFDKPEVILADCNCINYSGIYKFASKNNIPFISEIRDLWPLSIVEYLHFRNNNPIIRYLYSREKKMYKVSNAIIFSMEGGKDYLINKGWDKSINLNKVFNINNGIDINQVKQSEIDNVLEDKELLDDKFKIIYTGSIRQVNDIGKILDVAKEVKSRGLDDIRFIIYGDGDQKDELQKRVIDEKIDNAVFKGFVQKKYIPYICSKANVNIINVVPSILTQYGASWNKLFDYMAARKPILSTLKVKYDLIDRYDCGISTQDQSVSTIANAIEELYNMPKDKYQQMCDNAWKGAECYDFKTLTAKLQEVIEYAIINDKK
ncbi:MAG: glycosyltransferase family 4 protein [Christensenella sp.]|nr:glycosyltransferase family 4 protein [Christensenella sp.]